MLYMLEILDKIKGVKVAEYKAIENLQKAKAFAKEFEFPCWLKLDSPSIVHKTEQKAVLKCNTENSLEQNFKNLETLQKKFSGKIIIQKSYEGLELILATKKDKIFGNIIMLGLGGIFAEIMKNVSFRSVPLDEKDIKQMLEETKISQLMTARTKYPIDKLIKAIKDFSVTENLEINPLIVTEQEIVAVDVRES